MARVLRESEEFAKAYAGAERSFRKALPKADIQTPSNVKDTAEIFEKGPDFDAAVAEISGELLRLFRTQFHSAPVKFVRGGISVQSAQNSLEQQCDADDVNIDPQISEIEDEDD